MSDFFSNLKFFGRCVGAACREWRHGYLGFGPDRVGGRHG